MPIADIVIDANVVVRAILPYKTRVSFLEFFVSWRQSGRKIYAPDILLPEAVSVIRRGIFERWISQAEGEIAIEDIFRLGIEIIPSDVSLCQAALLWAGRLGQSKAYDGFYLAAAERVKAEFWTGDERLHNRASQIGTTWIHIMQNS